MNNKDKNFIKKIIEKNKEINPKYFYPLLGNAFSKEDLIAGIEVLISGQITMSKKTRDFEKYFANKLGKKYALMVNSGSSANLLAAFAACNPLRKNRFKPGDEVLIPVLCWSTSLWPLVQSGLKPVFVDVDKDTLNVNSDLLLKKINNKTKVIMLVHVLGNSTNVEKIRKVAQRKKIILIEDFPEKKHIADLVIDQNFYRLKKNYVNKSNIINYSRFFEKKYKSNIQKVNWAASNNVFLEYDIIKKHKLIFDKTLNKFGVGEDQLFFSKLNNYGYKIY